ncbi:MAG: monovalent cation/H(+) antiporter subunit G [Candidatus Nanopelagicales bacterium]|nr:monovalent cation/H(+) antiporter subunit G [Candidatus Nanopelagicales bacterium]
MTVGGDVVDLLAMVLLLVGSLFSLTAAIGLLRFPDVLSRLHAATKPQVLGVLLVVVGIGLRVGPSLDLGLLVLAGVFQLLTLPVAAHMVSRAVYRSDQVAHEHLAIDDLSAGAQD